jgi:transcriptional regulator with XRE-family HTH domain
MHGPINKKHPRSPSAFDKEVGRKIRTARLDKGMSQGQLGVDLGITFQQIQKYEKGMNKCPTSRLIKIAEVTGRSRDWFLPSEKKNGKAHTPTASEILGTTREGQRLAKAFVKITDKPQRLAIVRMVETSRGVLPPSQRLTMVREIARPGR